jgi:hypothetical protein
MLRLLCHAQVHKEDPTAANSSVAIAAEAEGIADGCTDSILGPVAVLSQASLSSLTQGAAAAPAAPAACQTHLKDLGLFLQQLQQHQGRPVYSVGLPLFFSLDRQDYALTDAFFKHYKELQRIATREVRRYQRPCDLLAELAYWQHSLVHKHQRS